VQDGVQGDPGCPGERGAAAGSDCQFV